MLTMSVKAMISSSSSIATSSKLMANMANSNSGSLSSLSSQALSADVDSSFIPPPEAPVFYPTAEEFACGPLEYIAKIRAEAEPHGICKIIPPNTFQPPFAVAVEEFRFTPRIQRLNELEATTRIKLNFIEQIVKFWDLQGSPFRDKIRGASFKIPNLERRSLDLYNLHKIVKEEGGFETCTRERKWSRVASRMGYGNNAPNKGTIASLLRQHYERILFPYDVFQSGATIGPEVDDKIGYSDDDDGDTDNKDSSDSKSSLSPNEKQITEKRVLRRQQAIQHRYPSVLSPTSQNQSKELRKLQFYGAGPKMPGVISEPQTVNKEPQNKICLQCNESNPTPMLLTCDNCDNTYHTHCLIPPLNDWPKGVWHCHRCLALLVSSHPQVYTHEFGFAQSQKNYTLSEFGEMADQFKADYFHCPPHSVPLSLVEKEFWRLVSAIEESVTVEYGADLHTNDYGSGFPSKYTKNLLPTDSEYISSTWNLNNLPTLEGSVFRHINANISGMIIPWMYVGMCFATFCWHNEDHWTYSINYLHWGEPKTWYGVPGEHAETFERAMKRAAPELFKSQPDLLHQLVTICNPNILMQDGVPVYRTNQHAGEFVVTFPRAYHTGFNQGLNFAEAVNFAPSDWLPIGRVCITHYAMLHRFPVFSHDELICKMANEPNKLEITLAVATYRDMLRMVECEKASRLALLEWGVTHAERENFELLPDDERQCEYCKTTCFLSALTCHCDQAKLVCINHKENLCNTCLPSQHTLRYRYTLDELPIMLHHLRKRAEKFDEWASKVQKLLNDDSDESSNSDKLPALKELRDSLNDAISNRYPTNSEIYEQLQLIVTESSKCSRAARDLLKQQEIYRKQQQQCNGVVQQSQSPAKRTLRSTAVKAPNSVKNENVNTKLTLEEINLFYEEILTLRCEIPESGLLKELVDRCNAIASSIMKVLETSEINEQSLNVTDLDQILSDAQSIAVVDFGPQLECFKHKQEEFKWLDECNQILIANEDVKINQIKLLELSNIRNLIESGMKLAASTENINSKLADLQQMLDEANKWIDKTKLVFYIKDENENENEANTRKPSVDALESLLMEVQNNANLSRLQLAPHIDRIRECYQKARDWISRVNVIFGNDNPRQSKKVTLNNANADEAPMIQAVEELVTSAVGIECQLEHLPNLNSTISAARAWKERLSRTFCKKNSLYSLLNIITPRIQTHSDNTFSTRTLYQFLKRSLITSTKERKGSPITQQTAKIQKTVFEAQLNANYSRACIVALYKIFEEQEIAYITTLRDIHKDKQNYLLSKVSDLGPDSAETVLEEQPSVASFVKFCICGKDANEWMIQCQLCWDWFHNSCVQNYSSTIARKKQATQQSPQETLHIQQHFICILCCRGRRPRLENVLSLLCSLQKLPIRILEGELLQRVAERAIAWQDKARIALSARPDLASGYARVLRIEKTPSVQLPQTNQTNIHSPTKVEKISDSRPEFQKFNSNEVLVRDRNIEDITTEESTAEALLQLRASHHEKTISNEVNIEQNNSQHFSPNIKYVSQESSASSDGSPLKHKRKSPLILRVETASQPLIDLNDESKQILEDLLLEGSCLEVTLDELPHLWHIWQYANANKRTVIFYNNKDESMPTISQKRKLPAANANIEQVIQKRKINAKEKSPKKTKEKKVGKKSRSDDDELCLMKESCLRPNAAEVNWVFCDGACNGWYHQLCIGIDSPESIASLEQFFCTKCRKPTN